MIVKLFSTFGILILLSIGGCAQQQHQETTTQADQKNSSIVFAVNSVNTRPDLVPNFSWKDSSGKISRFRFIPRNRYADKFLGNVVRSLQE